MSLPRKISKGARFGGALGRLGDIDGDGFQEFAVGAPFENEGKGAVYVYRGSQTFQFDGELGNNCTCWTTI